MLTITQLKIIKKVAVLQIISNQNLAALNL